MVREYEKPTIEEDSDGYTVMTPSAQHVQQQPHQANVQVPGEVDDSSYAIMHPPVESSSAGAGAGAGAGKPPTRSNSYQNVRLPGSNLDYENFPLGIDFRANPPPRVPVAIQDAAASESAA